MSDALTYILPLLIGWLADLCLGDPAWMPHPVVGYGKMIAFGEKRLNKGCHRKLKGAMMSVSLIVLVFAATYGLFAILPPIGKMAAGSILIFCCLAGTTLIREVRDVFYAVERSVEEGRKQVARIVGRDTSELSAQEVRTAALETLAENLSDGVIAPLFWLAIGGVPAMMAYKMVNTLDSMIGYRTERYKDFGCWAARIDDVANYIPARITALLMVLPRLVSVNIRSGSKLASTIVGCTRQVFTPHPCPPPRRGRSSKADSSHLTPALSQGEGAPAKQILHTSPQPSPKERAGGEARFFTLHFSLFTFVWHNGRKHASPNSGYPEAALAGILDCRFGGPHYYFGELIDKPYIGENARELTTADMQKAVRVNRTAEVLAIIIITVIYCL